VAKLGSSNGWKIIAGFVAGAIFGAFTVAQVAPNATKQTAILEQPGGVDPTAEATATGPALPGANPTATGAATGGPAAAPPGVQCSPGRNGGATDVGVTATHIQMATTVVRSGIGAAFLGDVQFAMEAVRNRVNREGGICGRQLAVKYIDDGWRADLGQQYIRNFIKEGVFAIPVGPSSEGLRLATESGDIRRAGIPVVGTDGLLISQYQDPWVWPVAVATTSSARILAREACGRYGKSHGGSCKSMKFAIVFDRNYRFGREAALAFNAEVRRLTGSNIEGYDPQLESCQKSFCGVLAGQSGYGTEVQQLRSAPFNFLAMYLEPQTALTWMATPNVPTIENEGLGAGMIGLGQPLFTRGFAEGCQEECHGMWVWTGYKPPIEDYATQPAVRAFVAELRKTKPDADVNNAFAEGGYVGMQLLVEGLRQVGPFLTRARLKQVLDSMRFTSGLALDGTLSWPASPRRFAATTMQAFEIQYKGSFGGWRAEVLYKDPTPNLGIG
jgi:ABC-type branched-subunit amino acid transport system substrate-binding protein